MQAESRVDVPKEDTILVQDGDLPLFCPGPNAPVWSMHPRIYIDLSKTGRAICPYCGAHYQLAAGTKAHAH